jgi:glycosyltransferase involved in cell wall biosynthesis
VGINECTLREFVVLPAGSQRRQFGTTNKAMSVNEPDPLVSIIVITYNSAQYVIETLESAKAQSYKHIELIVSDDCSTDDTITMCNDWLQQNKSRFDRVQMIVTPDNTGIPANCNRGLSAANGKWIKFIAGDDILLKNCISTFVDNTRTFPNDKFFVSTMYQMSNDIVDRILIPPVKWLKKTAHKQKLHFLTHHVYVPAPAIFMEQQALLLVGTFDERYPGIEELHSMVFAFN